MAETLPRDVHATQVKLQLLQLEVELSAVEAEGGLHNVSFAAQDHLRKRAAAELLCHRGGKHTSNSQNSLLADDTPPSPERLPPLRRAHSRALPKEGGMTPPDRGAEQPVPPLTMPAPAQARPRCAAFF